MLITERMYKFISGHEDVTSEKELLTFWEQYYINLNEDSRRSTFNTLKNEYFKIADEYEKELEDNPSLIEDELSFKKYTIRQRKMGIRMLGVTRDTDLENEAKTFESQMVNTPAGNRSAATIRDQARQRERAKHGFGFQAGEGPRPIETFKDFLIVFFANKRVIRRLIGRLLFYMFLELLATIMRIYQVKQLASRAEKNDYWSDLIGKVVGKEVTVKIIKSPMYMVFGCTGSIVIASKIIEKLSEEEVIALSLYSYGSMVHALSRGIGFGTLKFILVTSVDMFSTYGVVMHIGKHPDPERDTRKIIERLILLKTISELVLTIVTSVLNLKLEVIQAVKYVRKKGYLNQLMSARKKLPKKRAERIPEVDSKTANATANLFVSFLNLIGFKKDVDRDNISKPVSSLQKAVSIFKKFR